MSYTPEPGSRSNFVTCYDANNSIGKIRTSPAWDINTCRTALGV